MWWIDVQGLFKKLKSMELEFDTITNYYDLIKMYKINVSELELASYAMMNPDFTSCKEAMDVVEENKLENIKAFSADLVKEVEKLRKDIIRIRAAAQNEMILSAGTNFNTGKAKPPSMM